MIHTDVFGPWAETQRLDKYAHVQGDGTKESWAATAHRVATNVMGAVNAPKDDVAEIERLIRQRKFMPGGRYLAATGRPFHQTQNCLLLRAQDSRFGWSELLRKSSMALMTGAGIGVVYSDLRARGASVRRTGGVATGPLALMQMLNEVGRGIRQGGSRRSAIWAGLHWDHPDAPDFVKMKNWIPEVRALKEQDFDFPATMDGTNISVILDDAFFSHFNLGIEEAGDLYWSVVERMLRTGEPGFSIDCGRNRLENLRNACTEITSADSDDICNLGSINLARIESLDEMDLAVELGTMFLLAGTVYSDVPYPEVDQVRTKNRRLGLGLMGVHEWLLAHGKQYGQDEDLAKYLSVYKDSAAYAKIWANRWGLSEPVKTRAIAPTGTIGIVAETTTGIEPIFCSAYKRRYKDGDQTKYQYVVDPTAKRLVEAGVSPDAIEDAYTLAEDVERRVAFQAWMQKYVDHAISSTINLPEWGSPLNNPDTVKPFGDMLMRYLPNLRGVTVYPNGARAGQPLERVDFADAMKHEGEVFVEQLDACDITKGGSCGV